MYVTSADIFTEIFTTHLFKKGTILHFSKSIVFSAGSSVHLTIMCSTDTFALGQLFIKALSPRSCNPEVYITLFRQVVWNRMLPDRFTDSMAGSGPDQDGVVQASGPGEEDPAFVVGVLSEQATSQDLALLAG